MAYDNVRLPTYIERGSVGGLGFFTTITPAAAGTEDRNQNWEDEKGEWTIGYGTSRSTWIDDVKKHHLGRRGQAYSFPFRDWLDYRSGPNNDALPTAIGTGDGVETEFQLVKTYADSARPFVRRIFKPDTSTLIIYHDTVPYLDTDWAIDSAGMITFDTAPGNGVALTALYDFDVPVRYVNDRLDLTAVYVNVAGISSVKVQSCFPPNF